MFEEIYNFINTVRIRVKLMSNSDFNSLLKQLDYQETLYALYFRYF